MADNSKHRSDLRAGIFIIASVVLVFVVIVAIKGVGTFFAHLVQRDVRFNLSDDLGGLRVGDAVRLGGFKVGEVKSVNIAGLGGNAPPYIRVKFTIPAMYPLHTNAHIGIQTSITGTTVLNIDSLGKGKMLTNDTALTGHPSSITQLLATLTGVTPEVHQIITTVRTQTLPKVNSDAEKAGEAMASFRAFADRAKEMATVIGSLFGDTKPDFRATMAHLNAITGDLKTRTPKLLDHADTLVVKLTHSLDSAQSALKDLEATAGNARQLTGAARSIIDGNRSKINSMIANLQNTSQNLRGASVQVRQSPWRLLYRPGPGELDNLTLFNAARQFSEGASSINNAAEALRDASKDPKVSAAQLHQLMQRLNDAFGNFKPVEQKLWNSVKN